MHFVYLLQSEANGKYYIGYTSEVKKRVLEHNAGNNPSTKYGLPWKLVYFEGYASKKAALSRERQLKQHGKGLSVIKQRLSTK